MSTRKRDVITFKVDEELANALDGISNRSEFIRTAILAALDNICPLCRGSGILTPEQQKHWEDFSHTHKVEKCADCHSFHLVCTADSH